MQIYYNLYCNSYYNVFGAAAAIVVVVIVVVHILVILLFTAREAAVWELEERHLQERHMLIKRQLKDSFLLKRHQMFTRHEKVRLCTVIFILCIVKIIMSW